MLESFPFQSPLLWVGVVTFVVILVWLVKLHRQLSLHKNASRQQIRQADREVDKCNKQLLEVRSVLVGLGQKISEQEDIIRHLTERVVELENIDSDGRLYTRANKMVKLGADINELIEECELPKAEAELMMSLQNKIAGKEKVPPLNKPKAHQARSQMMGYQPPKRSR
ncbi:DUF2802 domain-containing protein [Vibrio methylphosphonaticus]|uniref:DUF2802 domain-containing protein n=1 Tax=Vibrio methylphosphonaticus TaxID=2946866 RepID=UPI00202AAE6C|nr:DUF2802 domain-containing protein [Vibrio methylphosphonaticus]MCL9774518.1 DUF2802 domain-containing protein [Vibrio methylphosphonaticus]